MEASPGCQHPLAMAALLCGLSLPAVLCPLGTCGASLDVPLTLSSPSSLPLIDFLYLLFGWHCDCRSLVPGFLPMPTQPRVGGTVGSIGRLPSCLFFSKSHLGSVSQVCQALLHL